MAGAAAIVSWLSLDEFPTGPASHRVPPKGAIVQPGGGVRRPPLRYKAGAMDMSRRNISSRAAWRAEMRATLALSWPLVLTNVAQNALLTADVILTGWLGPQALAAGALGTNLYFAALIFGIGLDERHCAADRRGARPQPACRPRGPPHGPPGPLVRGDDRAADRDRRLERRGIFVALGQEPALAAAAGAYIRALQWSLLPFLFYLVLRSFFAALERPGWALVVGLVALPVNVGVAYRADVRRIRPARPRPRRRRHRHDGVEHFMFVSLVVVCLSDRRLRRYQLFGRFWRADWPRYRELWRLGVPIGLTIAFEVTVFNAAALC